MSSTIAVNHEYCLIYAKNRNELTKNVSEESKNWKEKKDGLNFIYDKERELVSKYGNNFKEISNELKLFYKNLPDEHPSKRHKHYNNIDNKGVYFAGDISQGTGNGGRFDIIHPKTLKPCVVPTGGWRFGEKKLPEMISSDRIHFGIDESTVPCLKRYLRETEYEVAPSVFYKDGRGASKRVETLMNGKVFDFPKDEFVIKQFIEYCTSSEESECIILDFYGGSGTTAHSVFIQNLEDSIKRRFIQVQLP
jgi:adenine-specific DNA-methyltransferase